MIRRTTTAWAHRSSSVLLASSIVAGPVRLVQLRPRERVALIRHHALGQPRRMIATTGPPESANGPGAQTVAPPPPTAEEEQTVPEALRGGKLMQYVHAVFDVTGGRMRLGPKGGGKATRPMEEEQHDKQFASMLADMKVPDAGSYVAQGRAAHKLGTSATAARCPTAGGSDALSVAAPEEADSSAAETRSDVEEGEQPWTPEEVMQEVIDRYPQREHHGAVVPYPDPLIGHNLMVYMVWKASTAETAPYEVVHVHGKLKSLTVERSERVPHTGGKGPPDFATLSGQKRVGKPVSLDEPSRAQFRAALALAVHPEGVTFTPPRVELQQEEYLREEDGGPQLRFDTAQRNVIPYQTTSRERLPIFVVVGGTGDGKTVGACFTLAAHLGARGRVIHGNLVNSGETDGSGTGGGREKEALREFDELLQEIDGVHSGLVASRHPFSKYVADGLNAARNSLAECGSLAQELIHLHAKMTPRYGKRTDVALRLFKVWLRLNAHASFFEWSRGGRAFDEQVLVVIDEAGRSEGFARGLVAGADEVYRHLNALGFPTATVALCGTGLDFFRHGTMHRTGTAPGQHVPAAEVITSNPDNAVVVEVRQEKGKQFATSLWKMLPPAQPLDTVPHQALLEPLWENARLCSLVVHGLNETLRRNAPLSRAGQEAVVLATVEASFQGLLKRNGLSKLHGEPGKRLAVINAAYRVLEDTIADAPGRVSKLLPAGYVVPAPEAKGPPLTKGAAAAPGTSAAASNASMLLQHVLGGQLLALSQAWAAVVHERGEDASLVPLGEMPNERLGLLGEPVYRANNNLSKREADASSPARHLKELLTAAVHGGLLVQPHPHVYSASSAIAAALTANFGAPTVHPQDGAGFEELTAQRLKRQGEAQGYTTVVVRLALPYPRPPEAKEWSMFTRADVQSIVSHLNPPGSSATAEEGSTQPDSKNDTAGPTPPPPGLNTIGRNRHRRAVVLINGPYAPAADVMMIARDGEESTLHMELWDVKHRKDPGARPPREMTLGLSPHGDGSETADGKRKVEGARNLQTALAHLGTARAVEDLAATLSEGGRWLEFTRRKTGVAGQLEPCGEGEGHVYCRRAGGQLWRVTLRLGLMDSREATKSKPWLASAEACERTVQWGSGDRGRVKGTASVVVQHRAQLGMLYHAVQDECTAGHLATPPHTKMKK